MRYILGLLLIIGLAQKSGAQTDTTKTDAVQQVWQKFKVSGYGVTNYYNYDWETIPDKRNEVDVERFNFYIYYHFSELIEFKSEIEFEHGGTGVTMSFDPLEEFGEFESEIEKGGEVVLEQMNLLFKLHPHFKIRVGKMRFYMGNAAKLDKPKNYFTAYRPEVENSILPLGWYETGVEFSGDFKLTESTLPAISYKAYVVTGLDNSAFSSAQWVRRGYQTRFETINANDLAAALRLDYVFTNKSELGFCLYAGNTTGNRPKNDFTLPAWLTFGDIHFTYNVQPIRISAYGMLGHLQNSEALSLANQNLSNNLNVKRTPVGKAAMGVSLEAGYNLLHNFNKTTHQQLFVFGRYDNYDSMYKTEGNISNNPRHQREVITAGINYMPLPNIVFKGHYAMRKLGSGEYERTTAIGFGFDF
ncbi:MAG TPA: autotransporter outer membrane beta-barrel domain-containing protein [Bacteroidia bacterium]|nr:autotransporter outer membrane beta-barrel domain-containing protein [Bacteroidia bacterium]